MASLLPALSSFLPGKGGEEHSSGMIRVLQGQVTAPCPPEERQRCQAALCQEVTKRMKAGWQSLGGLSVVGGEEKGWSCGWTSGMLSIHAAGSPWVRRGHAVLGN